METIILTLLLATLLMSTGAACISAYAFKKRLTGKLTKEDVRMSTPKRTCLPLFENMPPPPPIKEPIKTTTPIDYEWDPSHRDASLMAVIQQSNDHEKHILQICDILKELTDIATGRPIDPLKEVENNIRKWGDIMREMSNKTSSFNSVADSIEANQTNARDEGKIIETWPKVETHGLLPESRFKTVHDVMKWAEEWIASDVIKEGHKWREGFRQCAVAIFTEIQRELATDVLDHKKGKKGRENENK